MSTKKVKNSSQSGKMNKPFAAPKTKEDLVEETAVINAVVAKLDEAEVNNTPVDVEVLVKDSLDSFDDAIAPGGGSFGGFRRKRDTDSRREHIYEITQEPVVSVAGKKVELTKLDKGPDVQSRYEHYDHNTQIFLGGPAHNVQRYSPGNVVQKDSLEWWKAELSEVVIIISSGSMVNITESLLQSIDYEIDVLPSTQREKKAELIVLASEIDAGQVHIGGRVVLNNSTIKCNGFVEMNSTTINGSVLRARHNLDVFKGGVQKCNISDNNRITLRNKTFIRDVHIAGFNDVNLQGVVCYGVFRVIAGYQPSDSLNLGIYDTQLVDFTAHFYQLRNEFTKANGSDTPWRGGLTIRRRTDYGYFSAREPIPFIRAGDYDIATPDHLYQAKEIDSNAFPKEVKTNYGSPSFGGGWCNAPQEPSESPYLSTFRGGSLWNKVLKDVYQDKMRGGTKPAIGKIGDALVQSVIEQIKSRVNLYIEFSNLP